MSPTRFQKDISSKSNSNNDNNMPKKTLVVMIPAYNEESTISKVIKEIPSEINGISNIKILVIDDGSSDKTSEVSKQAGAIVVRNTKNLGLARTFQKGLNIALQLGADIIVNTDADFQYNQQEIPKLIQPILEGKADIVSGNRQVESLQHMKFSKKYGNILGTKVVKLSAGYHIADASSGFRAFTREAAMHLFVTSKHTYTHETLIQAGQKNLKVLEIPVEFRKREGGDSKLISSVYSHIKKSLSTIVRSTLMYNPLKTFMYLGSLFFIIGIIPVVRWYFLGYILGNGSHLQSLILGVGFIVASGLCFLLGLIADLLALNRNYLEDILYRVKKLEYKTQKEE